ncbi:MAG: tRNA preQ1(34) S-adenosylmethionine ribosyltransferase-isomerase QueA [Paludibacteraceae bacterium]|jgi:S-adenosylmethionine:tRNA ribosyltransferase-isomerase|nr:tRNA preQ1(34) S-adenosylmethionine ribosyltransferase-isomerase QueA [Paludibacteraceae bacterium]MCR4620196.1 tRNA preQ1(34) S-adenosylmethionine ribosyltransferase-isomerase QueA [Paludibacteraceae bacterium]
MKLSKFNFKFNDSLIALQPTEERDASRLMVLHLSSGEIEHRLFSDIIDYFDDKDIFVLNNTRVFPARLHGNKEKTDAMIDVFLLRELNATTLLWDVLVDPARKIRIGNKLYFGPDESLVAEVIDNTTSRGRSVRFLFDGTHEEFKRTLFSLGETPIPDYIRSQRDVTPEDADNYQTIFATQEGAVVAPAAGCHLSRFLLKRAELKGIRFEEITLHAGLGNFKDIDVEDLTKHKMTSEQLIISEQTADNINQAHANGNKVLCVGITTLKGLETSVGSMRNLKPFDGWTNKFIYPPYDCVVPDALVTNFHLPYTPFLIATCAFGGFDNIMKAYDTAVKEGYKFGCYGDSLLILKD